MEYLTNLSTKPIFKSTLIPTQMTSPIISFSSNITMNGISNYVLDTNSQHALINVTAWSMKVIENAISYKKGITTSFKSRNLRSMITMFTTSYSIIAITQANIPLSSTDYANPISLYNNITSSLFQSVNTGVFTKQLQKISILFNATQIENANVTHVSNSALIVNNIIYLSSTTDDDLTRNGITTILMTTLSFILICGLYLYCRSVVPQQIHIEQSKEGQSRFSSVVIF